MPQGSAIVIYSPEDKSTSVDQNNIWLVGENYKVKKKKKDMVNHQVELLLIKGTWWTS